MTQQTVNIGTIANDGTGDPARTAFDKINDNFGELYAATLLSGGAPVAVQSVTTSGSTLSLAPTAGALETSFVVTCTQDCLVSIGAAPTNKEQRVTVDFVQDATGGRDITFDAVSWAGGVGPTLDTVAGRRSTIMFRCVGSDIAGAPFSIGRVALIAALPVAPASITVTAGNASNSVNAAPVTAYPAVTGYNVYRGTSSGGESGTPIASNVSLPYSDTGLTNGTAYYYKVAAVNSIGAGAMSPEGSGTPIAAPVNAAHFATFGSDLTNQAIYASPNALFNPGSASFEITARINRTSIADTASAQNIIACWDNIDTTKRLWWFGLAPDGRPMVRWATGSSTAASAMCSVETPEVANQDIFLRATVSPVAGTVVFSTSSTGASFTQCGATVTASAAGAVYTPTVAPYLVISANASGGAAFEPYTGKIASATFKVGGTTITEPVMGPTSTVDAYGITYSTSTTGVVYS